MRQPLPWILLVSVLPASLSANEKVSLQRAKYHQLAKAIAAQNGKVVVVDFWSVFCIPCMKKFPIMVDFHDKYSGQGLHIISVCLDTLDKENQALTFLKKQKATFQNLLLDEKPVVWQNKIRIREVPCFFIFDRQGRIERRFNRAPSSDELGTMILRLLNEKP